MLQQHIVSAIETNASLGWSELSVAGGGRCPELSWIFPSVIDYFGRVELSNVMRYCIAAWLYLRQVGNIKRVFRGAIGGLSVCLRIVYRAGLRRGDIPAREDVE